MEEYKKSKKPKYILAITVSLIISLLFIIISIIINNNKEFNLIQYKEKIFLNGEETELTIIGDYTVNKNFDYIYFGSNKGINLIDKERDVVKGVIFKSSPKEINRKSYIDLSKLSHYMSKDNKIYLIYDTDNTIKITTKDDLEAINIIKQIQLSIEQESMQTAQEISLLEKYSKIRVLDEFKHEEKRYYYVMYYDLNDIKQIVFDDYIYRDRISLILNNGTIIKTKATNMDNIKAFFNSILKQKYLINNKLDNVIISNENNIIQGKKLNLLDYSFEKDKKEIKMSFSNNEDIVFNLSEPLAVKLGNSEIVFTIEDKKGERLNINLDEYFIVENKKISEIDSLELEAWYLNIKNYYKDKIR